MGKHGPCYHCGVTSTPLWRNGPPEKPVLCNACGSRWRTKGTLVNYTPLHARAEPDDYEDYRYPRVKSMPIKNREAKVMKRKQSNENPVAKEICHDYNRGPLKAIDEETSNRSSSGSAISNSESCVQFGSADASDLTGPAQSVVWDQMVPSRKRTCINRTKQSPVEKLTKDLYTILHEQQSSRFSASSEEDLLFESDRPMVSVEIGHGSVLIRHPSSLTQEEESEASSLSVDNKAHLINDSYPRLVDIPVHIYKGGIEKNKRASRQQEETNREKDEHEKLQILGNHNSLLCYVDLKEMINFDVFASHLTNEEQQQLLQFLPDLDTAILPYSLQSMFASTEFEENLFSFQKLLGEGVFDLSFPGVKAEDCGTLKRLALCDSKKSKWMKQYSLLKDIKCTSGKKGSVSAGGTNVLASGTSANVKRLRDAEIRNCPGTKMTMKNPKSRELVEHGSSYFTPRTLFSMPSDTNMDSVQYMDESSDQDLLLDVPSNSSFPEAELLYQASPSSSSVYPHLNRP